jgi:hypothetical protein
MGFHPRQIIHTKELAEHQRAGMPSVYQWLLACASLEQMVGGSSSRHYRYYVKDNKGQVQIKGGSVVPLDVHMSTTDLHDLYCQWARDTGVRNIDNIRAFGRKLTEVCSAKDRLSQHDNGHRPWGH